MRLTALSLHHYGSFRDTVLALDPAPGRVNLILAPNGAGKSVLRSALGDLLFGIGAQTPMGFRHGYGGMQLRAEGAGPDGAAFVLERRKGRGNTLAGADGQPLPPALAQRLLGTADRALLERLFALDTERLRAGGQALLASGGDLAEALLQAAGGLRRARDLRQALEGERDRCAPLRRSAQRPFHQAADRLKDSRRQLQDSLIRPAAWREREAVLDAARQALAEARAAERAAAQRLHVLERQRRIRPLLARHAESLAWLAAHPEAPLLPEDLSARLAAARDAARRAEAALHLAETQQREVLAELEGLSPDQAVLEQAAAIEALQAGSGVAARARCDLPGLEHQLAECRAALLAECRALGLPEATAEAATPLPALSLLAEARRLAELHGTLTEALARAAALTAIREAALREEAAVAAQPVPALPEGLEPLLEMLGAEGDPDRRLAAAARQAEEARARLAVQLALLPAPLRDPGRLRDLPLPEPGALRRLALAHQAARERAGHAGAEAGRIAAALRTARQDRAALDRQGGLPDAEALARLRARREAGWRLIYRRHFAGEAPETAEEQAFCHGEPLPLAYARAVAEADRLADRRLEEAERLARAAALDAAIADLRRALEEAEETAGQAARAEEEAAAAWAAVVLPLGLDGMAGDSEVEAFLARRETALAAALALEEAEAAWREIQAGQQAAARRLATALALPGEAEAGLRALLDRAEALRRDARQAAARHAASAARRDRAAEALAEARRAEAEAGARLALWREDWRQALGGLGRDPAEPPGQALEALRRMEALPALLRQRATLEQRLADLRHDLDSFAAGTAGLTPSGEDGTDAFVRAERLGQRLREARDLAARRAALRGQAETAARNRAACREALQRADMALQGIVAAAGAEDARAAEERIALAEQRRRQEAARDEALRDLLEAGDGLSLAALAEEARGFGALPLEEALAEARAAQEAQAGAIAAAAHRAAQLEAEQAALVGDDTPARALQEQQAALAQLGRILEDALLMQAASGLLDAAMGRLRESGDDRLLRRIGAAFALLTEGAYPVLASREDARGVAHLVLRHRDHPEEEVSIEGLSEGTRDQLFLALRLVAIEDHAAAAPPLPFLGDDILQSFDDRRAGAAFRALLALSRHTQVILLSHHEHLAEVAAGALPEGALNLLRLLPEAVPG